MVVLEFAGGVNPAPGASGFDQRVADDFSAAAEESS
jgi:hypothetical protein